MASSDQDPLCILQGNLAKYKRAFKARGYDQPENLWILDEEDLRNLNIVEEKDKESLLQKVGEISVKDWLKYYKLDYHSESFVDRGITCLDDVRRTQWTPRMLDKLEMVIPGHRKRFFSAIRQLGCENKKTANVATTGYWSKSDEMKESRREFLYVDAVIKSKDNDGKVLQFLFDTGSEVVTLKKEDIQELSLQQIYTVKSRGIHTTVRKPAYSAVIQIGEREIEAEVIEDHFRSLGVNVIREFTHMIDSQNHIWLEPEEQNSEESTSSIDS